MSSAREGGACRLSFGTDDESSAQKYKDILELFILAQIKATLTDKISEVLWTKFLLMCPIASLTSVTGKTYGAISEDPVLKKKARELMEEVAAVARMHNIHLSDGLIDRTLGMIAGFGYHYQNIHADGF